MTAVGRRIVVYALKLSDLVLMSSCFACSAVPLASKSSALSIAQFFSMRVKIQNLALFIALLLIWHAVFSLLGLYDSGRLSSRRAECHLGAPCHGLGSTVGRATPDPGAFIRVGVGLRVATGLAFDVRGTRAVPAGGVDDDV